MNEPKHPLLPVRLFFGLLIGCLLLAMCAGCAKYEVAAETYDYGYSTHASEFSLRDGTRCVALGADAITCDWQCARGPE